MEIGVVQIFVLCNLLFDVLNRFHILPWKPLVTRLCRVNTVTHENGNKSAMPRAAAQRKRRFVPIDLLSQKFSLAQDMKHCMDKIIDATASETRLQIPDLQIYKSGAETNMPVTSPGDRQGAGFVPHQSYGWRP